MANLLAAAILVWINVKKRGGVKKLMAATITCFVFIFQGCVMDSELIVDVKQAREKDNSALLDVSSVVRKHVKKGALWSDVFNRLTADGFVCYERSPKASDLNLIAYGCVLNLAGWYRLNFGNRLVLDVLVKNGKVEVSAGQLIYLAL